jgi:hypothetical protein
MRNTNPVNLDPFVEPEGSTEVSKSVIHLVLQGGKLNLSIQAHISIKKLLALIASGGGLLAAAIKLILPG